MDLGRTFDKLHCASHLCAQGRYDQSSEIDMLIFCRFERRSHTLVSRWLVRLF